MSTYQKYTELDVWKHSRSLAAFTYELTSSFPQSEQFGIVSQIRRCVVSVPSNIAEGCGRQHKKETIQFLSIARGSLYELETQPYISKDLSYLTEDQLIVCLNKIENLGKLLNGFIRYNTEKKDLNKKN